MLKLRGSLASLSTSSLAHNTGWMLIGQGGNFFLQAGYFLLLARVLGVTEYGIFAGAFALVSSVSPYSSLGSQMIFMRYVSEDRTTAQSYWGNVVAITAASTLLLTPVLAMAGYKLFGPQSVELIAVLVVTNCLMVQLGLSASTVFQTFEQLRATAWLRSLANLFRLFAVAALLILLRHATAFQCSVALLAAATIAALIALIWVRKTIGKMHVSGALFRLRFWEGLGFSLAGSTQAVYNDIDKMMLSHYGMNTADGIYTMAYRIVDFATTPVIALDAAVLPRFFSLHNESLSAVIRMSRKVIPLAALAGVAAGGFTLLVSPVVIRIVGHGFAETLYAIRWLCWLPVFRGVHQLAGGVLTATGRQNYRTAAQLLVALLNFALNLAWIPSHGWRGAAWASLASDGLLGIINLSVVVLVAARATQTSVTPRFEE